MTNKETKLHEYAFDVKLFAVVRCKAKDVETARKGLDAVLDCMDLSQSTIDGINDVIEDVKITEASLAADDGVYPQGAELIEIDGEEPNQS